MGTADRRNALLWAIGWWILRRQLKKRAALAVAGLAAGATARKSRIRGVLAAVLVVAALAGAFLAWRRLFAQADDAWSEPLPPTSPATNGADGRPAGAASPAST